MDKKCECHDGPMRWVNRKEPDKRSPGYWLCNATYKERMRRRRQWKKDRMSRMVHAEKLARDNQCQVEGCDWHLTLHWHHRVPSEKKFDLGGIASHGPSQSESSIVEELAKCDLLCPNHHSLADQGITP